jgi:hypothetical protein
VAEGSNESMKNLEKVFILAALSASFCAWQPAHAFTTNLFPVADAAMRDGAPDGNFGSALSLPVGVGNLGSPHNRGLFKFSFTEIPTNALITSAALRLVVTQTGRPPADYDLKRLLTSWAEAQASWNVRSNSTPWNAGGAQSGTDYVSTPSATAALGDTGNTNEFTSPQLAADVQMWVLNPVTNFGWILIATGELPGTGKQVGSRENPSNEPVLIIGYTLPELPAPAAPPTIFGTARDGDNIRFSFNAQSNRTYAVEFRDSLTVSNWSVLTNIPALPANATVQITNTVDSAQRYFRARTP